MATTIYLGRPPNFGEEPRLGIVSRLNSILSFCLGAFVCALARYLRVLVGLFKFKPGQS